MQHESCLGMAEQKKEQENKIRSKAALDDKALLPEMDKNKNKN